MNIAPQRGDSKMISRRRLIALSVATAVPISACALAVAWCVFDLRTFGEITVAVAFANALGVGGACLSWLVARWIYSLPQVRSTHSGAARLVIVSQGVLGTSVLISAAYHVAARSHTLALIVGVLAGGVVLETIAMVAISARAGSRETSGHA
jgi:hypothetical protein